MKTKEFPKISIVIPTFNEEENIKQCLESIFGQDYPKDKLEVIVVDDASGDKTIEIAKKFPIQIVKHASHDPEVGKMLGFNKATGTLFMYLDADIHLRGKNWFKRMLLPLREDETIAASFTGYYSDEHSAPIERFLNLDPLQRDPIYEFFSPALDGLVTGEKIGYKILDYKKDKIPPAGLCLYRRKLVKPLLRGKRFLELDLLVSLVEKGQTKFAYVADSGLYHHHVTSLWGLMKKRSRNVTSVYLQKNEARKYRWFDLGSLNGFLKVLFWIFYANLFIPSVFVGIYKSVKHKTWVGIYEPFVNLLLTDTIILSFLTSTRGRKLIKESLA